MRFIITIANVFILLGAFGFMGAIIVKFYHIKIFGLVPFSFFSFANTSLLLGISLYIREIYLCLKKD